MYIKRITGECFGMVCVLKAHNFYNLLSRFWYFIKIIVTVKICVLILSYSTLLTTQHPLANDLATTHKLNHEKQLWRRCGKRTHRPERFVAADCVRSRRALGSATAEGLTAAGEEGLSDVDWLEDVRGDCRLSESPSAKRVWCTLYTFYCTFVSYPFHQFTMSTRLT